jgi:DNA-directed RNA polymerase subunit RPC12/RpoP
MITFTCHVCRSSLSAQDPQAGSQLRCPTCLTVLTVPQRQAITTLADPGRATGRRFPFQCGYCSSRLEANESMSGQEGHCPTCDSQITIPILQRDGRLMDPKTRQIIKPDPHPVHAYAAAGARAPQILRRADGTQLIRCTHCGAESPISANNCKGCGMPFTLEGTTKAAPGTSNGFCTASLVLGIISLPLSCTAIPPILAIIFGIIGYRQAIESGSSSDKNKAIAGMVCALVGGGIVVLWTLR